MRLSATNFNPERFGDLNSFGLVEPVENKEFQNFGVLQKQ